MLLTKSFKYLYSRSILINWMGNDSINIDLLCYIFNVRYQNQYDKYWEEMVKKGSFKNLNLIGK